MRPLTPGEVKRLQEEFMVEFTYNSNAIEGNTLTLKETAMVLDGMTIDQKPLKDHLEAVGHRDAFLYIQDIAKQDVPLSEFVIKNIHSLVLMNQPEDKGVYRRIPVRIMGAYTEPVQPYLIEPKITELLKVNEERKVTMNNIERIARFHLEFEGIHPFIDGNGRTGRYWQTAILGKWRSAFYAAPLENIVWENQSGYYLAIRRSTLLGNSEPFIDFMLERILQAIKGKGEEFKNVGVSVGVNVGVKLSARERDLLELLRLDGTLTAARIAETYSISTRQAERLLTGLKKKGFLVRKGSDKAGHWEVVS